MNPEMYPPPLSYTIRSQIPYAQRLGEKTSHFYFTLSGLRCPLLDIGLSENVLPHTAFFIRYSSDIFQVACPAGRRSYYTMRLPVCELHGIYKGCFYLLDIRSDSGLAWSVAFTITVYLDTFSLSREARVSSAPLRLSTLNTSLASTCSESIDSFIISGFRYSALTESIEYSTCKKRYCFTIVFIYCR